MTHTHTHSLFCIVGSTLVYICRAHFQLTYVQPHFSLFLNKFASSYCNRCLFGIPVLKLPLLVTAAAAAGGTSYQAGAKDAPPTAELLNTGSGQSECTKYQPHHGGDRDLV